MRNPIVHLLFRNFYKQFINYDQVFYDWVGEYVNKDSVMLDVGAGSGKYSTYNFKEIAKKVVGIDPDSRVLQNTKLHESFCMDFFDNNFPDNTFDIVFANCVVEHIKNPDQFLNEIKRILKPDGYFFFRTTNILHYAMIISKYTPHWFHQFYCDLLGRKPDDTFPTYYKLNTPDAIKRLSQLLNFQYEARTLEGQPDYLFIEPITFLLGVVYERLVNKYQSLNKFRVSLMVKIRFE